jgi:hypothetical protein
LKEKKEKNLTITIRKVRAPKRNERRKEGAGQRRLESNPGVGTPAHPAPPIGGASTTQTLRDSLQTPSLSLHVTPGLGLVLT